MKIACTQCGADVEIDPSDEFIVCPYCKSALYIDFGRTVLTRVAKPIITRDQAVRSFQKCLEDFEIAGDEITKCELVFIPYWQLETNGQTNLFPACGLPTASLHEPDIPQTTDFLDADSKLDSRELLPDIPLEHILTSLEEQRATTKEPKRIALFKIPFYQINYTHRDEGFEAYVDGIVGSVFYDDLPPSQSTKLDRYFGAIMGISFAVLLASALIVPSPLLRILTTGATGLALYAFLKSWTGRGSERG